MIVSDEARFEGAEAAGFIRMRRLGEHGPDDVWEADRDGRAVTLRIARVADRENEARFRREAAVLTRLQGVSVVGLVDVGEDWIALDRVEGETLAARLERGPLPPAEAWAVIRSAASVLAGAHAAGVFHGELNPVNVILAGDGVVIADFGVSALDPAEDGPTSSRSPDRGSPASTNTGWRAPERWWGLPATARTDVYGLAACLYTALTGRPAWEADRAAPDDPTRVKDPVVAELVARGLARDAAARPESVTAFVRDGDAAFRRRRPPLGGLAAAGVLLVCGYAGSHAPWDWFGQEDVAALATLGLATAAVLLPAHRLVLGSAAFVVGWLGAVGELGWTAAGARSASPLDAYLLVQAAAADALATAWLGSAALAAIAFQGALKPGGPRNVGWGAALLAAGLLVPPVASHPTALLAGVLLVVGVGDATWAAWALCAASAAGLTSIVGARAAPWAGDLDLGARAVELDRGLALAAASVVLMGASLGAAWLVARVPDRAVVARLLGVVGAPPVLAFAVLTAVVGARDAAVAGHRETWAELDVPRGTGVTPGPGPLLTVGRSEVAVDEVRIMARGALANDTGRGILSAALAPRLAGAPVRVAADRTTRWSEVCGVLAVVRGLGQERVELLFDRGAGRPPGVSPVLVLPSDLVARMVTIAGPAAWRGDSAWGDVATRVAETVGCDAGMPTGAEAALRGG